MEVTVTRVASAAPMASLWFFEGEEVESGDTVRFAVDHRPARHLAAEVAFAQALPTGDPVVAEVEEWQVLSRRPAIRLEVER